MTRKGSIKETGEELPDAKWRRFEAAVGVSKDRKDAEVQTDQRFRKEAERPGSSGEPRPDDAGDPERERDARKKTKRTE